MAGSRRGFRLRQETDWIEGTLVTVDVRGVWRGRLASGLAAELEMTLTQHCTPRTSTPW